MTVLGQANCAASIHLLEQTGLEAQCLQLLDLLRCGALDLGLVLRIGLAVLFLHTETSPMASLLRQRREFMRQQLGA